MQRPTIIRTAAATLVAATLTLAACGGGDDDASPVTEAPGAASTEAPAGENVITIASLAFSGATSVPAGSTITVVNNDGVSHTFTADDGSFDSGTIQPGGSVQITLDAAGDFAFHCNFHPAMVGSITVTG